MSSPTKEVILSRKKQLEKIKETLKQEFIGIDDIIDELTNAISSWYLVPSMQKRPLVINLWGMTGVGKTALVKRMAELIDFSDRFYHFDIGESNSWEYKAKHRFKELSTKLSENPFVCCFDDFQFARTKAPDGRELDKPSTRFVWELMDSGILNLDIDRIGLATIYEKKIDDLKLCLKEGVVVENGKVVQNKDLYLKILRSSKRNLFGPKIGTDDKTGDLYFIPEKTFKDIKSLANQSIVSVRRHERKFAKLNGPESIQLLEDIFDKALTQGKIDCTQALIFIIGNLDEAFSMSGDINPDLSADRFHENSLKINVSNIKQTLQSYFRQEQVARLGNNHLIYPALNEENFRKIIDLEFEKINRQFVQETGVPIVFHPSVQQLMYKEGVYPSLGTRPLFSTIHSYITSKLGLIVSDLITRDESFHSLLLTHENEHLIFKFRDSDKQTLNRRRFSSAGRLSKLREPKRDDQQALSAVHESGHAVLAIRLMGVIPAFICSNSADASNQGFIYIQSESEIINKKDILARAAMGLGGYLAEKLVFGKEYVHTGSSNDLEKTTRLVSGMIKKEGMGSDLLDVNIASPRTNSTYHDNKGLFNEAVLEVIRQAEKIAEDTLKNEMDMLLKLANYLSDNRKIDKQEIIQLLGIDSVGDSNKFSYRERLKEKTKNFQTEKKNVA